MLHLRAGHVLGALSLPVLEALAGSPAVARHAPDLAARLREVLDRRRPGSSNPTADRAPYRAGLAGSGGAFELQAFTSDGLQRRSQVQTCNLAAFMLHKRIKGVSQDVDAEHVHKAHCWE